MKGTSRSASGGGPAVIGHRGACGAAPENTMAAFRLALEQGVDGIEFDVRLTRDEVPVIYHDRTLHKIGHRGRLQDRRLQELRDMDFGSWFAPGFAGEPIVTLCELLDEFWGRTLLAIELKADGESIHRRARLAQLVAKELTRRKGPARWRVLSFESALLEDMAARVPTATYVRNVDQCPSSRGVKRTLGPATTLCLPARMATGELAETLHRATCGLWVYRCDRLPFLTRALRIGADAIITDRPDWARAELARLSAPRLSPASRQHHRQGAV